MMRNAIHLLGLILTAILAEPLGASATIPLVVTNAWTRATPGGVDSCAVYLDISSPAGDRLIGVKTAVAAMASLHIHQMKDGVATMRPVDSVTILANKSFAFAPMGYHIMLTGLKAPLKAGDQFPLVLEFAHAGDIVTTVTVKSLRDRSIAAPMANMPTMSGMDMKK